MGGERCTPASPPRGVTLSPKTVCSGSGGLRYIRHSVGTGGKHGSPPHHPPASCPYLSQRSTTDRKPGRLGCIRRCGGTGRGGSIVPPFITLPLGVPIPQNGLPETEGTQVYPPLCQNGVSAVLPCSTFPLGVQIPQNGLLHTGGTRVYPPSCGDGEKCCTPLHHPPTGRPYPPTWCALGRGESGVSAAVWEPGKALYSPLGVPIPQNGLSERGDSCASDTVWGQTKAMGYRGGVTLGVHIPPDCYRSRGLGCSRRPGNPKPRSHPIGRPYPRAAMDGGGLGRICPNGGVLARRLGRRAGPYHEGLYPCCRGHN